jgi:chromosome segregation ATPase
VPPEPLTSTVWLEQQLQRALARIDALAHEVETLNASLRTEQANASQLQEELALLNGRTIRHETSLDVVRRLQTQVAALEGGVEAEASLRRDASGALEREQHRDATSIHSLEAVIDRVEASLARLDQRLDSIEERQRGLTADMSATARTDTSVDAALETLDRRIEALATSVRRDDHELASTSAALPGLRLEVAAFEARLGALQDAQRRFEDELAQLQFSVSLPDLVADAAEQVRSLRERVEVRLQPIEESVASRDETERLLTEQRDLLRRELAGHEARLAALDAAIEAQRDLLIEHVRRATAAAEDHGRRQLQEIDRQARAGRELLRQLTERAAEGSREQPL